MSNKQELSRTSVEEDNEGDSFSLASSMFSSGPSGSSTGTPTSFCASFIHCFSNA